MKFRFSVDDNIWVFKDIAHNNYSSIFDNEYMGFFKYMHERYDMKVQLNIFYKTEGFNLSEMPDKYKNEWKANSDWLKLSFHAIQEFPEYPYVNASYDDVKRDCELIHNEIIRFAGIDSLSLVTTVHYFITSKECCMALKDCGIKGLVSALGTPEFPERAYYLSKDVCEYMEYNSFYKDDETELYFVRTDLIINAVTLDEITCFLNPKIGNEFIEIMIHEQYFHKYYEAYQVDFKEKVIKVVRFLMENNYTSVFLDEIL